MVDNKLPDSYFFFFSRRLIYHRMVNNILLRTEVSKFTLFYTILCKYIYLYVHVSYYIKRSCVSLCGIYGTCPQHLYFTLTAYPYSR